MLVSYVVGTFASGYLYEEAKTATTQTSKLSGTIWKWSAEHIDDITAFLTNTWNEVKTEYDTLAKSNIRYISNNSNIKVNTDSLRNYADRLNAAQRTVANINANMNYLYSKVGLLDILDLIRADALTGYSWRLKKCENYLNNTANTFDNTENKIKNAFE